MERKHTPFLILILLCLFSFSSFAQRAGKIWISGDNLFINVPQEGVMVMDNKDPESPSQMGYIAIPGSVDIAVVGDVLYANHYDDLVVMDWKEAMEDASEAVLQIVEDVFPNYDNSQKRPMGSLMASEVSLSSTKGGSASCFALNDASNPTSLYAVSDRDIKVFTVDNPRQIRKVGENIGVRDQLESAFVADGNLFVGAQSGMYIFNLNDPQFPDYEGRYNHLRACDPVVVEGEYAYLTIRDGEECGRTKNELHVINISDLSNPRQEGIYAMNNPHGLGVDKGRLFVCDGDAGLKVYDARNPRNLREVNTLSELSATFDVIPVPQKRQLIAVAGNNIIQYRYDSSGQLRRLSEFSVEF